MEEGPKERESLQAWRMREIRERERVRAEERRMVGNQEGWARRGCDKITVQ